MQRSNVEEKQVNICAAISIRWCSLEALRHLVSEHDASQIMIGTDYAVPCKGPVDHILNTPGLTDAERIAILGGNAAKLIKIPT
jgi:hypothetical protein